MIVHDAWHQTSHAEIRSAHFILHLPNFDVIDVVINLLLAKKKKKTIAKTF